jgi:enamine deaminase RidA (YjgF/YER057c/UK114 family)
MKRINIPAGNKWENIVRYSRLVKVGPHIFLSGTTSVDEFGQVVGKGDSYAQTIHALKIIRKVLEDAGSSIRDVVRTRLFVTNIDDWEEVGRAHGDFFKDVMPACTLIGIDRLVDPEMLVEVEVEAVQS